MSINTTAPSGVLGIDKPPGPTSHDIVAQVRHLLTIPPKAVANPKVGHAGTLDPFASGVLVVAIGSATRLLEYTRQWPKEYQAVIVLGESSDTDDHTGKRTPVVGATPPSPKEINNIVRHFQGEQWQTPPVYSARKVKGKKLYQYARTGLHEEALAGAEQKRKLITIYQLRILDYTYPHISLIITCSGGTYIRALARDIGLAAKTGAYLAELRRTAVGKLRLEKSSAPSELTSQTLVKHLLPPTVLIENLPALVLNEASVAQLRQGQAIEQGTPMPVNQPLALFDQNKKIFGVGSYDAKRGLLSPSKIIT